MKKTGPSQSKPGIVSRPIFHNESKVQRFADGGEVFDYDNPGKAVGKYEPAPQSNDTNIRGEKLGTYSGNDEIVKRRMGMIDESGNSLLRKDNVKYESIDDVLKEKGAISSAEASPVEPPSDTVVRASAPKRAAAPKAPRPQDTGETIGPQVTRMTKTADAELLHDESSGSYDQMKAKDKNRPYDTPFDGLMKKIPGFTGAGNVDAKESDYKRNWRR